MFTRIEMALVAALVFASGTPALALERLDRALDGKLMICRGC
jgi:hypothetical protein